MIVLDWFEFLITIINRFKDQPASIWDHSNTFAFNLATTETREGLSPALASRLPCSGGWSVSRPGEVSMCLGLTDVCPRWLGQRLPGGEWGHCLSVPTLRPQWQPSPEPATPARQAATSAPPSIGLSWLSLAPAGCVTQGPDGRARPPCSGQAVERLVCRVLCPGAPTQLPLRDSQCSCVCTHMCQPLSLRSLYHCLLRISTTLSSPSALPSPSSLCNVHWANCEHSHELNTVQFIIDDILHWFMTLQRNSPGETSPFKH